LFCRKYPGQVLAQGALLGVHLFSLFASPGRTVTLSPNLFGIPAAVVYGLVLLAGVYFLGRVARWLRRRIRGQYSLLNRVLPTLPLMVLTVFVILLYMPLTFLFADFCLFYDAACEPKSLSTYWFFWVAGAFALWRYEVVSRPVAVHRRA
jgi:hypothetical protein